MMSVEVLKLWAICTVLLSVKMWANAAIQVHARFRNKIFVNPEDARVYSALMKTEFRAEPNEHPLAQRAALCWRNDLENIPLFMILSLGFALLGGPAGWAKLYFSVFVVARVLHTYFYVSAKQPWRTVAYEIGALASMGIAIHVLYLALA